MKTKMLPIILVVICTVFTSLGQILWKIGSASLKPDFAALITNYPLILGFISYAIGAALLIIALKWGELSVLYPFVALSFIWVNLASVYYLGELLNFWKWAGIVVIVIGVSFIGLGSKG